MPDENTYVCLFCGDGIDRDNEAMQVTLGATWTEAKGSYWAHGGCLQEATHPSIPLYLLSLLRDEAVYGSRPTAG